MSSKAPTLAELRAMRGDSNVDSIKPNFGVSAGSDRTVPVYSSQKVYHDLVPWCANGMDVRINPRGAPTTKFWQWYGKSVRSLREYDRIPKEEFDVPKSRTDDEWRLRILQQR
jgi:hypothetical protein